MPFSWKTDYTSSVWKLWLFLLFLLRLQTYSLTTTFDELVLYTFLCLLPCLPCILFFFLKFIYYLFIIYFWLCWVFVSVRGLSLVVASGGHSSSWCAGLSLSRPLLLRSTGSRRTGSVVVAHGLSCSAAWGIFRDQGSNPCPLPWQADSQPLRHQGSPLSLHFLKFCNFNMPIPYYM